VGAEFCTVQGLGVKYGGEEDEKKKKRSKRGYLMVVSSDIVLEMLHVE
jgi:hypothetical protein